MARITKFNRYSIIYVDDEAKARKYFELTFRDTYNVICADSPESALALLDEHAENIALLITDQRMPREQGTDLIRTTKSKYPHITRILTTAYADLESAIDSVNKGEIFRYILKPWDITEFREHINQALQAFIDNKEEQLLLAERRQSIFKVASNIAHELRTPLTGIYATVSGIQDDFPELVRVYELAASQPNGQGTLTVERLQAMQRAFYNIQRQVKHSQAMITMLLENIRDDSSRSISRISSMRDCLDEALDAYPFFKHQEGHVMVDGAADFGFMGNKSAIINIFHNLLKNSLYALQASSRPDSKISIRLERSGSWNHVYFRDDGTGIPSGILPLIFDDFYSSKGSSASGLPFGNGIGLAFCKRALSSWSAEIECQSVPGEYTEFFLKFPELEN